MAARNLVGDRRVLDDLNREWGQLVGTRRDDLPKWAEEPPFAGCRDLDAVLASIALTPDVALLSLLVATRSGDPLAPRVVLQALLPKMVRMALRDSRSGVEDYVAQLWCVVRAYPVERRPVRVAANLALDTLKQVARERAGDLDGCSFDGLPDGLRVDRETGRRSEGEQLLDSAHELRLIDSETGAILRTVYLDGLSSREAAARHGSTAEMVRYRCSRAVRRLAGHAVELAAA